MISSATGIVLILFFASGSASSHDEVGEGSTDVGSGHFQPMVALLCGQGKYLNQYLDDNRQWVSDPDPKAICRKDKLEILEYCRKVYPNKDVRNIVESSHFYKIDKWCKAGQKKCKKTRWVKPYRCLEGPFQSDALLVPEHCLFDHIHNQSVCQSFDEWNSTAAASCEGRNMKLKSFAMLLPCGVDIFSGVEFVCCPKEEDGIKVSSSENELDSEDEEDDEQSEDDEDDDDYDEDEDEQDQDTDRVDPVSTTTPSTTTTTTTTTTTAPPPPSTYWKENEEGEGPTSERPEDFYFTHFNGKREHDAFKAAQKSLQEAHRDKVTKHETSHLHLSLLQCFHQAPSAMHVVDRERDLVMKEWTELEDRYQKMKAKDPKGAEDFRKKMSAQFQRTVEALEEEGAAEKRKLVSMHQQRVMTIINLRRKTAMNCYTSALDRNPPKSKKIEKCLEKLLRALEKDRAHSLHHYRHLMASSPKQALREKEAVLDHLDNVQRVANHSLLMLDRVPVVARKIRDKMVSLWRHLNDLGMDEEITRERDEAIVEKYWKEAAEKQQEIDDSKAEDSNEQQDEKQHEVKDWWENRKPVAAKLQQQPFDPESVEDESLSSTPGVAAQPASAAGSSQEPSLQSASAEPAMLMSNDIKPHINNNNNLEEVLSPRLVHAQKQAFHHNEVTYSVRKEEIAKFKWNGSVYITLAFAGIALLTALVVGIALLRRHSSANASGPLSSGRFMEVDQAATPEERHVASMQINGYENPTYKYFETQSN